LLGHGDFVRIRRGASACGDKSTRLNNAVKRFAINDEELVALGFSLCSTSGTGRALEDAGLPVRKLFKLQEGGRPTVVDLLKNGEIQLIINTPFGQIPRQDENMIRSQAILRRVCIITTLSGARAALQGIKAQREKPVEVRSLQEYGKMIKK